MPFELIKSLKNEGVKHTIALRDRKVRDKEGLTIIDGIREFQMATNARVDVQKLYLCRDYLDRRNDGVISPKLLKSLKNVFETTPAVFEKLAFGNRHEGIVAVVAQPRRDFNAIRLNSKSLVVVLEGVEKPGNLGAVLRTCDAAGVDALIVCDGATDVYNPSVIRSSLGAVFSVCAVSSSAKETLAFLKSQSMRVISAVPDAQTLYSDVDYSSACALVLGGEHDGLSNLWLEQAALKVKIPMVGQVNSLNVSSSAAIIIYEAVRQRRG